jgi:hypothetical protein
MTIESGWKATSEVLDGEAEFGRYGYNASTDERVLFVSHGKAGDVAEAVWLCRRSGLLRAKLEAMKPDAADIAYATTLPRRELEN